MIADDLRLELVQTISRTPIAGTEVGRNTLLAGIPNAGAFARNPANGTGDITVLILQLEDNYGREGEWRLLRFIHNAAASVPGTELGRKLETIRQDLQQAARPRTISAAETAQVHLFDLRQSVMMCVGQLPPDGGISGFVVPGATPRLLRYFCDSLRHRGVEYGVWTRDRVAAPTPPLFIGPLQTAVSVAAGHATRVRQLLAVKHVLWPAYVENTADGDSLWQAVKAVFDRPPQKHMVVVFGMPEERALPAGMLPVPSPRFTSKDVASWITDIAKAKAWHDSLVKRWTTVIVMGFTSGGALPVDIVYDRLEHYHGLVNEHRDDEQALLQALEDLELIGE
jgi:hypothetical protein